MSTDHPSTSQAPAPQFPTSLGTSDLTTMSLLGRDVPSELMGEVTFGELAYWLLTLERPTRQQGRLFEAVLLGLADHGFTPTAIATRLTFLSAPDSVQGALAAGILGGGSRYLGVTEDTGRFLREVIASVEEPPSDDAGWDDLAEAAVRRQQEKGGFVPGLGHPVHKQGDPRTPRIIQIAHEERQYGANLALFEAIGRVHERVLGKRLPLNGAGVSGAALADLGIPTELLRGTVLLARCAGLLGHIAEEIRRPIANSMYLSIDRNAVYVDPQSPTGGDAS